MIYSSPKQKKQIAACVNRIISTYQIPACNNSSLQSSMERLRVRQSCISGIIPRKSYLIYTQAVQCGLTDNEALVLIVNAALMHGAKVTI